MARDIEVKVRFNADEYLAVAQMADEQGLSHSAFLRQIAKQRMREFVIAQLSLSSHEPATGGTAQTRAYTGTVNPVVGLSDE